jgi:hypothetical protein
MASESAMEKPSPTLPPSALPAATLDLDQLQTAVSAAKERFSRIRDKYPQL